MSLTDHVGILVAGSFDRPQKNRLKPAAPPEYYAVVAFEPNAGPALAAAMAELAPGGNWQAMNHSVKKNSALNKPYAGIPDNAIVVRFATKFAVEIRDEDGTELVPTAENSPRIRVKLFTGQRVRINGAPYAWNFQGKQGLSWNLYGVMAVGGGERRPGGSSGDGFGKYLPETGASDAFASHTPPRTQSAGPAADPFQQNAARSPAGSDVDPFGAPTRVARQPAPPMDDFADDDIPL